MEVIHDPVNKIMQVQLQKVGDAVGTTFPQDILEQFDLKEGDVLTLVVLEDGIKLVGVNPEFDQVMAAYQQGASQYFNAMRELADG